MAAASTAPCKAEVIAHAGDVLACVPLLEDLCGEDQRPYLAQLKEWAELVLELASHDDEHLPSIDGRPLQT